MSELTGAIFDQKGKTQSEVVDEIMVFVEALKKDFEKRKGKKRAG